MKLLAYILALLLRAPKAHEIQREIAEQQAKELRGALAVAQQDIAEAEALMARLTPELLASRADGAGTLWNDCRRWRCRNVAP